MCEFMASNSDLSLVTSYCSGAAEDDDSVDFAVISVSCVFKETFVLLNRLRNVWNYWEQERKRKKRIEAYL